MMTPGFEVGTEFSTVKTIDGEDPGGGGGGPGSVGGAVGGPVPGGVTGPSGGSSGMDPDVPGSAAALRDAAQVPPKHTSPAVVHTPPAQQR